MASDRSTALPPAPKPNWDLPAITAIKVAQKPYKPRKMRNFESPLVSVPNAVEILVSLAEPIPIRAMPPVLHVGETILTESEGIDQDGRELRFWMFDPDQAKAGAPIALAWMGDQTAPKKTKFVFQKPD